MEQIVFKNCDFTTSEIKSVASLHLEGIRTGFLSSLGLDFLVLLYQTISQTREGILVAAIQNERVIGFASATVSNQSILRSLVLNSFFRVMLILLPNIFSLKKIKKIGESWVYSMRSGEKKHQELSAELLSMAVDENHRRTGVATKLFGQVIAAFRAKGTWKFKIVVGDALASAQRFYETTGAQKRAKAEVHKGEVSWIYVFDAANCEKCWGDNPAWVRRHAALLQRMGRKAVLSEGVLWASFQRMIVPIGPVSQIYNIPSEKSQADLMRFFSHCIMIRTGRGFVSGPDTWFAVLCDRWVDLGALSDNTRSKVRRGLKNCIVRRLDARTMAKEAWPVYVAAFTRYRNPTKKLTEKQYRQDILAADGFEDVTHFWGVFERQTGRLIAYAQNFLYDKEEVNYHAILFHPDYLRIYSSYALFYEMNRYYLEELKVTYANDGYRSLLHKTNIQDFLASKFHFRNQPVALQVQYRPFVGRCMSATYPFRYALGRLNPAMAALYKLEEINRG